MFTWDWNFRKCDLLHLKKFEWRSFVKHSESCLFYDGEIYTLEKWDDVKTHSTTKIPIHEQYLSHTQTYSLHHWFSPFLSRHLVGYGRLVKYSWPNRYTLGPRREPLCFRNPVGLCRPMIDTSLTFISSLHQLKKAEAGVDNIQCFKHFFLFC